MKTKNIFLSIITLMFFTSTSLFGQFNIRGGLNLAKISSSDKSIELKSNPGIQLGFGYELDLGSNLSFRPSLLYSQKGAKVSENNMTSNSRTNYLELPMDVHIRFGDADDNRLGIYAGPYVGFLLSATTDDANVKDLYKSTEYGFNAGLTYDIYMITVGLNYGAGLSNVADDTDIGDIEIKNQNLSLIGIFNF
ncbi:MAG: PorT family protein [Saprospiraceae bacterium]|nr:PorT family protein [Saprospiraceae bacterium]